MLLLYKLRKGSKPKRIRQSAAANSVFEVDTIEFSAQQGLHERLDRGIHFESLAQSRRSYVTNAVVMQAAERATTAKTPSERCSKQRTEVYTLAFSA